VAGVRSWLYAPGHSERILGKVFDAGADAVLLDLEDAVPAGLKETARRQVVEVLESHPEAWVRINAARTEQAAADLEAVAGRCAGLRVPKVESAGDVAWVAERAAGLPLTCGIESALGVVRAFEVASCAPVRELAFGGADLALDLGVAGGWEETLYARSALVVASRAAGRSAPVDGVFTDLGDLAGLRAAAQRARRLGYFGKSALHPRQVPVINEVFQPGPEELDWARRILEAFERSGGAATRLEDGEFVDAPVAERARRLLEAVR
jgi:citrate lyase subunit beta / citryl-CoA lyase